jgi:hypothetical protein
VLLKRLVIGASFTMLAGCSDSKTGPTGLTGALSFTYSGALSGTFNVTGQMPTSTSAQETSSWAAGEVSTADATTFIAASTPRSASTHDLIFVVAGRTTEGSATIDFDNCVGDNCSTVFFLLGHQNGQFGSALQSCELITGSIVITDLTSTRIKGTFSGTGRCFSSGDVETGFTVTNGSFDVPITAGVA